MVSHLVGQPKVAGHVLCVTGAQFGSEGKGVIVNHLASRYDVHVRVGGPNAGHSFNHNGQVFKMQVIPCGWTNPDALLVLGRGMLINPNILLRELKMLEEIDKTVRDRLYIDAYAGVLDPEMHNEGHTDGELHQRIGSTGEGVGAARLARISRDPSKFHLFHQVAESFGLDDRVFEDTPGILWKTHQQGGNILLEGTQGTGLSLIHGPWPYVTSHDTTAAQMCADVGMPVTHVDQVLIVARTYPIRVAGNSGPLKGELTWDEMSRRVGTQVIERTTVTQKVRRIGEWDSDLVWKSVVLNGPTSMALTFLDYRFPEDTGKTKWDDLSLDAQRYIIAMYAQFGVPISLVGTGGEKWEVLEVPGARL